MTTYCDVFGFLFRSLHAMACLFDCFGLRNNNNNSNNNQRRHTSTTTTTAIDPPVVVEKETPQKLRLSPLFTAEEKEESVVKEKKNETLVHRVGRSEVNEELVEEAKFLKAWGTLPETPVEIRKRVTIVENSDVRRPQSMQYSSPQTPDETNQEETGAETFESSEIQSFHTAQESSPVTPDEIQNVDFASEHSVKQGGNKPHNVMKTSPYPTPIRITDDMQTPGTVFATDMKSLTKGNGRIRSQYVHTVLNPIQNLYQLDELEEENTGLVASEHEGEHLSTQGKATPPPAVGSSEKPVNDENLGDVSLSAWLKPVSAKDDGDARYRRTSIGKIPGDRPIIGLVATHWNPQEEVSNVSPKGWDSNGIPNSTTKYKEDQKVCWHATPFEERLEKALSEEIVPQRKLITGAPITFEEMEGQDTATSQFKSMTSPKSVISF